MKKLWLFIMLFFTSVMLHAQSSKEQVYNFVENILGVKTNAMAQLPTLSSQAQGNVQNFNTAYTNLVNRYVDEVVGVYYTHYKDNLSVFEEAINLYHVAPGKVSLPTPQNVKSFNKYLALFSQQYNADRHALLVQYAIVEP